MARPASTTLLLLLGEHKLGIEAHYSKGHAGGTQGGALLAGHNQALARFVHSTPEVCLTAPPQAVAAMVLVIRDVVIDASGKVWAE